MSKLREAYQILSDDIAKYLVLAGDVPESNAALLGERLAALLHTAATVAVDESEPDDTASTSMMTGAEGCVYMSMRDLIQYAKREFN